PFVSVAAHNLALNRAADYRSGPTPGQTTGHSATRCVRMSLPLSPLPAAAGPLAPPELALAEWTRALRPSTIAAMMGHMARPGVISFALGLPAPELFPVDDYLAAA